tara:strand:- start:311 stop:958 length:648 start_codon:yes stop_codon:yes gene_type:complete
MTSSLINCKQIFRSAYENRYTWPANFCGYKGNVIYEKNDRSFEGNFSIGKDFKININDIYDEEVSKSISSQLFEVVIHRVKRDFNKIHQDNNFHFLKETERGIEMKVSGKNDGDKYIVKNNSINMVFRKIHGIIIEIFVEEFFETSLGILSKKYSSRQLDQVTLQPQKPLLSYVDDFVCIDNNFWILKSRSITYQLENKLKEFQRYNFTDISLFN